MVAINGKFKVSVFRKKVQRFRVHQLGSLLREKSTPSTLKIEL